MSEPWVRFEDEHLLVVAKPAGVRTRRAGRHGQDGIAEWAQARRPGVRLSVLHEVDEDVSGLVVLGASDAAASAFRAQRERGGIVPTIEIVTRRDDRRGYRLHEEDAGDASGAATVFEHLATGRDHQRYAARPVVGDGRRVRAHARALGLAVLGDRVHGGDAACRVFLHETSVRFTHPDGGVMELAEPTPASFGLVADGAPETQVAAAVAAEARRPLVPPATDAFVWIDRHHDGFPGVRVEWLGDVALVHDFREPDAPLPASWLDAWLATDGIRAVYRQHRPRRGATRPASLVAGAAPARFEVRELGCTYGIDLEASPTSSGLFLDQRETRRTLLATDRRGTTALNAFAHTGSLSVAAALAGAETLTQDLSTTYLDWARDNFVRNGIDPDDHDFVYGDALDWLARFVRKGRRFDLVLVDPPSTSTTKKGKRWSVARDLHELVALGAQLTSPGGTLYVSTNMAKLGWLKFLDHVERGLTAAQRTAELATATLPLDHRSARDDPPYLKAAWLEMDR